jgi:hypothetical protein
MTRASYGDVSALAFAATAHAPMANKNADRIEFRGAKWRWNIVFNPNRLCRRWQHAKICRLLEDSDRSLKAILVMQCLLVHRPGGG